MHVKITKTRFNEHRIKTEFKHSYGFKSEKYREAMIFVVSGTLYLPTH